MKGRYQGHWWELGWGVGFVEACCGVGRDDW
jgi:hypothetical protein